MSDRVAAIVLAGGAARRMGGGDKPLLTVGSRSILAHILDLLDPAAFVGRAIVANGDPARFAAFGLPVIDDGAFAGQGPLAGILAGMIWARGLGADAVMSIPGDTPFAPTDLLAALTPAPACSATLGQAHHLVALWPVREAERLRALLSTPGPRHVARFAEAIGMRQVDFPVGKWDPFTNINSPADLMQARGLADQAFTKGRS